MSYQEKAPGKHTRMNSDLMLYHDNKMPLLEMVRSENSSLKSDLLTGIAAVSRKRADFLFQFSATGNTLWFPANHFHSLLFHTSDSPIFVFHMLQ